jgi:CheY-like chemotaxis protein
MITGRQLLVPIKKDPRAAMIKARFEVTHLVKRDDPDIPPPVYSLILRMVAFDPTLRFQNYEQLMEAIHQVRVELKGGGKVVASASGPKTVFIVEANTKLQDVFREKLKARGYRVLLSINAPQAQTRFQQQPYDALIVDCGTAGFEGLDVYNNIMQNADLKRLECSGILILNEDQADWAEKVVEVPKSAMLIRPVTMRQITEKLEEFVPVTASTQ